MKGEKQKFTDTVSRSSTGPVFFKTNGIISQHFVRYCQPSINKVTFQSLSTPEVQGNMYPERLIKHVHVPLCLTAKTLEIIQMSIKIII